MISKNFSSFCIISSDNPDVDVKGANLFKQHLHGQENSGRSSKRSSRRGSLAALGPTSENSRWNQRVESILVCTGVYNPENDLLVYLRNLFDANSLGSSSSGQSSVTDGTPDKELPDDNNNFDANNNELASKVHAGRSDSRQHRRSNVSMKSEDMTELRNAMSRKNSFISYFDDKLNVPDLTVNTLKDAVDYIIKSVKEA
jgi:hypothetical protein